MQTEFSFSRPPLKATDQPRRTHSDKLLLLSLATAGLGLILPGPLTAQTFTTMHSFYLYGGDGANPYAGVVLSGDTMYGTTLYGGSSGNGAAFKGSINGTGF